ncbi:hypothetical protein HPB52_006445 [Rhipicephalus sanguineus]|uniref:MADF domain-containing protein n=1 Tax=Rhipicephalus sanguineus TaxID=34632 RepID=A0A9D4Q7K1_RHISA|nr:hypothetical protein HPB52_006445 [Rhipicephalus sanguineus]
MASAEGPSLCSDELLAGDVRQRPILYDQRLKTYRDKQLQNDAWLEVAGAMKQSVVACARRCSGVEPLTNKCRFVIGIGSL